MKMKTILLIDDDEFLMDILSEVFQIEGYRVMTAMSAGEGLCLVQHRLPDVILCDWIMPGAGAYALLRHLESHWRTATIPFFLVTGWSDIAGIQRWTGLPSERIITKPFRIAHLLKVVNESLTITSVAQ